MRSSWCSVFLGLALVASSCAPSTNQACTHNRADGTRDFCSDFQSGFSDDDVRETCTASEGYTVGPGPCEAGYARCVIDLDGRVFTQHFYLPAERSIAQSVCLMVGGRFESP